MADCNDLFQEFLARITVTSEQRENLQTGKDAIRKRIQTHFADQLKVQQPSFLLQGSYALKTMVRPLGTDDYDLDDGVYLEHTDDDISTPSPRTASEWIVKATEGHVKQPPEYLKNCVRVVYAGGYHIDLPVYRQINGKIHLGTLEGNQWIPNDAKAFNTWFYERLEATEQMRSCIKYLKAWRDFLGCDLKGIQITVLCALNHVAVKGRDDESIARTVEKTVDYLEKNWAIENPVDRAENLLANHTDSEVKRMIQHLQWFCQKAASALEAADKTDAAHEWQTLFGDRFTLKCKNKAESLRPSALPLIMITKDPKPHCAERL